MKSNIQKGLTIIFGMCMMVFLIWFIFNEPKDHTIDQVYLSDILDTDEYIPTLDEVIEKLGHTPSYEEVKSTYDMGVAELHSNKLLPFESELVTIEDSEDLQAIKRVYYDYIVTGISPREPEYYLDKNQTFTVNHQKYHINTLTESLFVTEPGFTHFVEGIDAGYFQVTHQSEELTKVEGLIKMTEDKTVDEVLQAVNELESTLGSNTVQTLVEVVDEETLINEPSEFVEHEELYRYQDGGGYQFIIDSYNEYRYLHPHLSPYIQSTYANDELQLIKGTVIEWQGFVDSQVSLKEEEKLTIGENTWTLKPQEDQETIEVE